MKKKGPEKCHAKTIKWWVNLWLLLTIDGCCVIRLFLCLWIEWRRKIIETFFIIFLLLLLGVVCWNGEGSQGNGREESERNSGATGTRRFALSVCVRAWLNFPESCQDFVAWLLIIRVAPSTQALPWIDWTCRTFELVPYLCIYIPHERNNVIIIRLFCFVLYFSFINFILHSWRFVSD